MKDIKPGFDRREFLSKAGKGIIATTVLSQIALDSSAAAERKPQH